MDVEFESCYKDGKLRCSSAHTHTHTCAHTHARGAARTANLGARTHTFKRGWKEVQLSTAAPPSLCKAAQSLWKGGHPFAPASLHGLYKAAPV